MSGCTVLPPPAPPPANACASDQVEDCDGGCAEAEWLGDGFCDESYEGHSLNCPALNNDNGDCDDITGDDDFVVDCNGQRAPKSWAGDGACDNGVYQHNGRWINLNCMEADWDGGDCAAISLSHMDCLGLIQDLDHCEAVTAQDGYRCQTNDCVQALQALAAGWDHCNALLGLEQDILGEFQLVCGACSPMPAFEMCGLGVNFPNSGSSCDTLHCADAMVPWYEEKFDGCQSELTGMAESAGLTVQTALAATTSFYNACQTHQANNAPPPSPECEPIFLGPDIGYQDVMSYSDADGDCVLTMAELATVCASHYDECISFLASSEPAAEPAPDAACDPVYLGPDIGYANIMEYHDDDGSCTISMAELASVCESFFNECISFLNSSEDTAPPPPPGPIFAVDGWMLMQGDAAVVDLGGDAELEFASLLRQDLSAALEVSMDFCAITNIYASDATETGEKRTLHVNFELSAPGDQASAQALFDNLLAQKDDTASKLMTGVVTSTISDIQETRDGLATRVCEPVFLGPDIGYVNIRDYNEDSGECSVSMAALARTCSSFMAECIAFLNDAPPPPPPDDGKGPAPPPSAPA